MEFSVLENHLAIAESAACEIAEEIRTKNERGKPFVLGLATGSTMEPLYKALIKLHKEQGLDFSNVKFFNLDNYIGLSKTDRNNYAFQLRELFLNHINAKPENIDLVSSDKDFDLQAYEERILASGGIDIQLLGIGRSGHIGFNEVGSSITSISREIELSQETLEDNGKYFNQIDDITNKQESIPHTAHTRGIALILQAKKILCLANGHGKAPAIKKIFEEGLVEEHPARALLNHENTKIIVDQEALSLFSETELSKLAHLPKEKVDDVFAKTQAKRFEVELDGRLIELCLPPQFDFFDPAVMGIDEPFDFRNDIHTTALIRALRNAKQLSAGAHPDDAEIMAGPMMLKASEENQWLTLILTNGAASNNSLNEEFKDLTPEELTLRRQREQRQASAYAKVPLIMCKFPSPAVTGDMGEETLAGVRETLSKLFASMTSLETVYAHQPFDKHATHKVSFARTIEALRTLSDERLNAIEVKGMEVWGSLDVCDHRIRKIQIRNKQILRDWQTLIAFYESQIAGQGRDYSLATIERAQGHAGYQTHPHGANPAEALLLAAELSDLVRDKECSLYEMLHTLAKETFDQKMAEAKRDLRLQDNDIERPRKRRTVSTQTLSPCGFFQEKNDRSPSPKNEVKKEESKTSGVKHFTN